MDLIKDWPPGEHCADRALAVIQCHWGLVQHLCAEYTTEYQFNFKMDFQVVNRDHSPNSLLAQ